jgi:alpha-beta hydrolase superfamily lysophospholipase
MKRTLSLLLVLGAVLVTAASAGQARTGHSCVRGGELWFHAADGTKLVGHRFGSGTTAVILVHQGAGDLCQWVPYARRLAAQGLFAFPIDLRNFGFSQKRTGRLGQQVQRDVIAAVKALRGLGKKRIFVVGASYGALAAVVAAPNTSVAGVVSLSAPDVYLGLNGLTAAARLRAPVLYAATDADQEGRFATAAQALFDATVATDKQLELLPGEAHGIAMLTGSTRLRGLVEGFFRSH